MRLLDNEIRDIVKYLESGKALPDSYRFLLFGDKREVELVWNGKTGEVCNAVLPFQTIEHVDEPRAESGIQKGESQLSFFDARGRQLGGWSNKLIWGDNKLILSSLKNGPLREVIRVQDENGELIEKWTGDYIFENEWQSFGTKKDRSLELKSVFFAYPNKGRYKIAVKVVDIFGNDTMKIIEVGI